MAPDQVLVGPGSANMTAPFPDKSKEMHRRAYKRLWREHGRGADGAVRRHEEVAGKVVRTIE